MTRPSKSELHLVVALVFPNIGPSLAKHKHCEQWMKKASKKSRFTLRLYQHLYTVLPLDLFGSLQAPTISDAPEQA